MVSHSELKETDLIKDHRELLRTYMKENTEWKFKTRKKILTTYDNLINKDNIRYYVNREIKIFLVYLATGQIKKAAKYFPKGFMEQEQA